MKSPDEKLTLKLRRSSIERAKVVAKKRGTSVSRLVEEYFNLIAPPPPVAKEGSEHPIVDSLAGSVKHLPADYDWKQDRVERLMKKYGYK